MGIPVSSVESIPDQMRASDTSLPVKPASVKGRRGSLIPQADIIDPEHGNTQDVARAQAEEAVIAAKLAEAERNFAEKAEKARKQQEEIERVRAKQRAKEEEEQKKKEQSLTSKFMKLGEKATGWTMGEQKNRPLDEKPPIVFKGVNDFSPTKGYSEQMERERQEELRRRKAESEMLWLHECVNVVVFRRNIGLYKNLCKIGDSFFSEVIIIFVIIVLTSFIYKIISSVSVNIFEIKTCKFDVVICNIMNL